MKKISSKLISAMLGVASIGTPIAITIPTVAATINDGEDVELYDYTYVVDWGKDRITKTTKASGNAISTKVGSASHGTLVGEEGKIYQTLWKDVYQASKQVDGIPSDPSELSSQYSKAKNSHGKMILQYNGGTQVIVEFYDGNGNYIGSTESYGIIVDM